MLKIKVVDENGQEVKVADVRKAWSEGLKAYSEAKMERDRLYKEVEEARRQAQQALSDLMALQAVGKSMKLNFVLPKQRTVTKKK